MGKILDFLDESSGLIFFVIFGVITALAVIRVIIKMKKREPINITPVGVFNDLPESVTGIKKTKDWERKEENQPSACPGLVD